MTIVRRRNVRLRELDEVSGRRARLRQEEAKIELGRNRYRIWRRRGGWQVNNSKEDRKTCNGGAGSRTKRAMPLHPRLMVMPRCGRGMIALMVAFMVMLLCSPVKQDRRESIRADLQCNLAIPTGHKPNRNERAKRERHHQEAGKPPVLAQGCETHGHQRRIEINGTTSDSEGLLYPGSPQFGRSDSRRRKRQSKFTPWPTYFCAMPSSVLPL